MNTELSAFNQNYSKYYDLFYRDKPYKQECDFLEDIFKEYGKKEVKTLLDMGCGTGGHIMTMAQRGYNVIGIDSAPGMIEIAKEKAKKKGLNLDLRVMKFQDLFLGKKFDVIECMFNTIDYIIENDELKKTLSNVKTHLKKRGLFIFDFRNAAPSLNDYSPKRVIHIKSGKRDIFRISKSSVDSEKRIFNTKYECFVVEEDRVINKFTDFHKARFFYPEEMKQYVEERGLSVIAMCPFLELNKKVTDTDWNICTIARKEK